MAECSRGALLARGLGAAVVAAAAATATIASPRPAQAIVDVGLRKEYIDPNEFFRLEYPIGAHLLALLAWSSPAGALQQPMVGWCDFLYGSPPPLCARARTHTQAGT